MKGGSGGEEVGSGVRRVEVRVRRLRSGKGEGVKEVGR